MLRLTVALLIVSFLFVSCSDNVTNEPEPGKISGKVLNSKDQAPVQGVSITTTPSTTSLMTNTEGEFEFNELAEGEYTLTASKLNFVTNSVKVSVNSGKTTSVIIALTDTLGQNLAAIEGTVTNSITNLPVPDVSISTTPASTTVMTDADGMFKLEYILPGDYNILAEKSDYNSKIQSVKVLAGQTITVPIKMTDKKSTNNPPDKPVLINPTNQKVVLDSVITLEWSCSDPDGDELIYDVLLSESNPPDKFIARNIKGNQLIYTIPNDSTKYYWEIIARDIYDDSSESDIYQFEYIKNHIPSGDIILHYTFDNKDAADNSGYNNNGILRNNPEFVAGKSGLCAKLVGNANLDGTGSYIDLPGIDFKQYSSFTIALWVYEEKVHHFEGEAYINWGIHSSGWIGIGNYLNSSGNNFLAVNFSCGAIAPGWGKVPLWVPYDTNNRNKWVHYALVFSDGVVYGYIDGVNIGHKEQVINKIDNYAAIGKHWWNYDGTYNTTSMDFRVDEVRVYKRALIDNEIKALAK